MLLTGELYYRLAFSIMHRILSFVSKHKIRLNYHWVELWPSLTSTLHFTAQRLEELQFKEEFPLFLASVSFPFFARHPCIYSKHCSFSVCSTCVLPMEKRSYQIPRAMIVSTMKSSEQPLISSSYQTTVRV